MADPELYIHEFLYRGRPSGSDQPTAWHVELGAYGMDAFGRAFNDTKVLNMEQAEAAGWTLPKIIAGINSETLKECETLRATTETLIAEKETLANDLAQLKAALPAESVAVKQ